MTIKVEKENSDVSARIDYTKASAFFKEFSQRKGGLVHSRTDGNR
jgi:hypothetical protein